MSESQWHRFGRAARPSVEDLTRAVKEKARSLGANLVGVAPMERMADAPPDLHPRRLLPEARSIVSMAYRLNRAVQKLHLRGVSPMPFSRFAGLEPKARLDDMALDLANWLEDLGWLSLPVPANQYYYQNKGYGEISHKHVAMAAGLGRLGRGGFLVTPPIRRRGTAHQRVDRGRASTGSDSGRKSMPGLPPTLCGRMPGKRHPQGQGPGDYHGGQGIPIRLALVPEMPVGVRRPGDGRSFLRPLGSAHAGHG